MKIIVDESLINYEDEGQGKIILILHGWADSIETFGNLAKSLTKDYRVVRLDLPGFGESEIPRSPWKIIDYARLVRDFCKKINIDPDFLLGHSFGGRIIIKLLARKLLKPKKIILLASAGVKETDALHNKFFKAIAKSGKFATRLPGIKKYKEKLRRKLYQKAGTTDYLDSGEMKQVFLNVINEDLRDDATKINIPTLLIWGLDDTETPTYQANILNKSIRNSRLKILTKAGHFVFIDQQDETIKLIREFL